MRVSVMRIRFNPRTHVGCDFVASTMISSCIWFQSTHPRRVRPHIQQMSEYHITKVHYLRIIYKFLNTYVNLMGI